ncbi:MAG: hypothetical protein J5862_05270, partial [Bacteroidales bacterium]|nr:hypothetical protein [Bacteroidales bacterium]
MKKLTLILVGIVSVSLFMASCKSQEKAAPIGQVTGDVEIALPFTGREYQSDDKFFRAKDNGKSMDMPTAKKMAMLNAQR